MPASRPMTFFAGDAYHKTGVMVSIEWGWKGIEIGRVALQTARNYRAIEIRKAIAVSRAVHPPKFSPIGNGELKELISFPEQVGLPLPTRSYYQVKPLRAFRGARQQKCGAVTETVTTPRGLIDVEAKRFFSEVIL